MEEGEHFYDASCVVMTGGFEHLQNRDSYSMSLHMLALAQLT